MAIEIIHNAPVALPPKRDMLISEAQMQVRALEQELADVTRAWIVRTGIYQLAASVATRADGSLTFSQEKGTHHTWDVVVEATAKVNLLEWI